MSSLRRLTLPPRCLKRDRTEYDSEHSEDDQHPSSSPVSPPAPVSMWSLSSSPVTNDEGCSDRRGMAKVHTQGEGGREAKRSRVRGTATATGEAIGRGEEGKDKGTGSKRGGGAAAWPVPPSRSNKIGINHMDLLYETKEDKMVCRMCRCVVHHYYLFFHFLCSRFSFHDSGLQTPRITTNRSQTPNRRPRRFRPRRAGPSWWVIAGRRIQSRLKSWRSSRQRR